MVLDNFLKNYFHLKTHWNRIQGMLVIYPVILEVIWWLEVGKISVIWLKQMQHELNRAPIPHPAIFLYQMETDRGFSSLKFISNWQFVQVIFKNKNDPFLLGSAITIILTLQVRQKSVKVCAQQSMSSHLQGGNEFRCSDQ